MVFIQNMKNILAKITRLRLFLFDGREQTFLGKQQLYVFVYYTFIVVAGLCLNLIGISGPQKDFNLMVNLGYIFSIMSLFASFFFRKIHLSLALFCVIMVTQVATVVEMINCAYSPGDYHLMLIVGNMVLLAVNILISLIAYLKYTPWILCVSSMGAYIVCMKITGNESLGNFFGTFLIVFALICILGGRLVRNMRTLEKENTSLKQEEEDFFKMIGQDRAQVRAYFELAQEQRSFDKAKALLGMLGDDMRRNVIANVREYLVVQEMGMLDMKVHFPELSAAEREMCLLILQGKKLNDICAILGKKESTITSTRAHIRRKLALGAQANLKDALEKRVKKPEPPENEPDVAASQH